MFRVRTNADPATFGDGGEGFGETGGCPNDTVFEFRWMQVAITLHWIDDFVTELPRFAQDGIDEIRRGLFVFVCLRNSVKIDNVIHDEPKIGNGATIRHLMSFTSRDWPKNGQSIPLYQRVG